MRDIIAHFSATRLYRAVTFYGVMLSFFLATLLFGDHGHPVSYAQSRFDIRYTLIVAVIAAAVVFKFELLFIRQALFDNRNAVWIKDGVLVYLDTSYFAQKCSDIANIATGTYPRDKKRKNRKAMKAIVFTLRDGSLTRFPYGALVESGDEVVKTIKAKIGI